MCKSLIAKIFGQATEKAKPVLHPVIIQAAQVAQELAALGLPIVGVQLDSNYAYLTSAEWHALIDYMIFSFPWPKYVPDFMDCDKFAILFKGLSSALFGINCDAIAIGTLPEGGHAWTMFRDEQGWLELEPQNFEIFPLGSQNYSPKMVII